MCFIDPSWSKSEIRGVSRRQFLGTGLAAGLTATAVGWSKSFLLPGLAEGPRLRLRVAAPDRPG